MCLIIEAPANFHLDDADVRDVHRRNPQGFGFMGHDDDGKLVARRYVPRDAAHACELYRAAVARVGARPHVLHWRYATHGPRVDVDMAHPFKVADGVHVVHNGVIPRYGTRDESDTSEFVRTFLAPYLDAQARAHGARSVAALLAMGHASHALTTELAPRIGRSSLVLAYGRTVAHFGEHSWSVDGGFVRVDAAQIGLVHRGAWFSNRYAWAAPRIEVWRSSDVARALDACSHPQEAAHARKLVHPVNPFARVRARAPIAQTLNAGGAL